MRYFGKGVCGEECKDVVDEIDIASNEEIEVEIDDDLKILRTIFRSILYSFTVWKAIDIHVWIISKLVSILGAHGPLNGTYLTLKN